MKLLTTLCAFLVPAVSATAQEELWLPTSLSLSSEPGIQGAPSKTWSWSSDILLRYTMIGGDTGAPDLNTWDDIFDNGIGLRGEGSYLYNLDGRWSIGGYFSTGFDFFGGTDGHTDPGFPGVFLAFDDWFNWYLTVGPKAAIQMGKGWFAEAYLGLGLISYGAVDTEISGAASGSGGFIDASVAFMWEIGARVGYKFSNDRGPRDRTTFGLLFGIGYSHWNEPEIDPAVGGSAEAVENFVIDLGLWIGF